MPSMLDARCTASGGALRTAKVTIIISAGGNDLLVLCEHHYFIIPHDRFGVVSGRTQRLPRIISPRRASTSVCRWRTSARACACKAALCGKMARARMTRCASGMTLYSVADTLRNVSLLFFHITLWDYERAGTYT